MNWNKNQDSSVVERQARDLEVRVRIPVQVQIVLLQFIKYYLFYKDLKLYNRMEHCTSKEAPF